MKTLADALLFDGKIIPFIEKIHLFTSFGVQKDVNLYTILRLFVIFFAKMVFKNHIAKHLTTFFKKKTTMEANVNHRVQMLIDYLLSIKKIKSINDFDKQIGVSRNNTRNIISGRSKEPSFDFTRRTLSTFNFINPDWFLHNEGPMIRANEKVENLDEVIEENKNLQRTVNGLVNMLSLAGQNFKTSNFQPVSNRTPARKKRVIVSQLPLFASSVANSTWLRAL